MTKYIITLHLVFCVFQLSFSQEMGNFQTDGLVDYLTLKKMEDMRPLNNLEYADIKGSPYLVDTFVLSKVYLKNDSVYNLPVRYNIYTQTFEFKLNDKAYAISNPQVIKKITMDDKVFIYYTKDENPLYYQLLVSGKNHLFLKREVRFQEAGIPTYKDKNPPKFTSLPPKYFILKPNSSLNLVKNNKAILKLYPQKKDKLQSYFNSKKLSARRHDDIIKIVSYCNTLN